MPSLETANVGKAVAARVGTNIRKVRTRLSLTQAQLAAPEFSISYISAIERGKIRPSLKALSILARRLDVPLTFLLEGSPSGATEARAVVDLRSAVSQGEALNDPEYTERARNLLGEAYFHLYNYTLAMENHQRCNIAVENGHVSDPVFALSVLSNLANDSYRLGDLARAIQLYTKALE